MHSDEVGIEPLHSLLEGLLLGPLLRLHRQIAADSEAVRGVRVQVDLVWLADLGQDLLGLVALLGREDGVCLGGGDG